MHVADFLQDAGFEVYICGFEKYGILKHKCVKPENINQFKTIILPLPTSKDLKNVYMPFSECALSLEYIEQICKDCAVFGGNIKLNHNNYTDYYECEELNILNAVPTAEGAIYTAIQNGDVTIYNSNCLIIGNGRIGKILSDRLCALKANVTVSARKESDIAFIKASGYTAVETKNIKNYINTFDYIFNTVPALVLTENIISRCKKDAIIIDLASMPGGTDFNAAKKLNIKSVHALSLPSKVAPKTAAKFIAETLTGYLTPQKGEKL